MVDTLTNTVKYVDSIIVLAPLFLNVITHMTLVALTRVCTSHAVCACLTYPAYEQIPSV